MNNTKNIFQMDIQEQSNLSSADKSMNYDMSSSLLKNRILHINGAINDSTANLLISQLLHLETCDSDKPISIYINSPGGYVTSGLAIIDTMNFIKCEINTICIGQACSMAALILAHGTKGCRMILPNSRVMIHQPSGGAMGTVTDINIMVAEINKTKVTLNEMLAFRTGQPLEKIKIDVERDFWMSAIDSKEYGIVDRILNKRGD